MGDNMASTLSIGSFGGRTYIEVNGEDITPEEAEGRSASGKRIKQIMARKENGEASFAKRVAASVTKAARMPIDMPKEDTKIVMRPRGGLNVGRTEVSIIMSVVMTAARVTKEEAKADTICTNAQQNSIVVSTPDERRATLYSKVKALNIGGRTYEVSAYRTAPDDTVKGVIRGIAVDDTPEEIAENVVNPYNPLAVEAHRIGNTTTVIVLFAGQKVPNYVKYGSILVRCGLYRKHFDVCKQCGKVGHRRDVCPNPNTRVCFGCGIAHPSEDHERECKPKCRLCGGQHPTGERECKNKYKMPYVVKKREWERKMEAMQQQPDPESFPPLRAPSVERPRGESRQRDSGRKRDHSKRGRSASRRRPSQSRERATWADAVKVNMAEKRQPPAQNSTKKIQEMNGPAQERKQEEMTEDEPEVEVDPRTTKAAGPAPKRRATEGAKERKITERIEKQDDRFDHLEATSKVTNERLTALEQTRAVLQQHLQQLTRKPDVIMIQETLSEETPRLPGYRSHDSPPSARDTGESLMQDATDVGLNLVTDPAFPTRIGTSVTRDTTPDLTFVKTDGGSREAQWRNTRTAQLERLTETRTGRQILRDLGLEPREGKPQTNVPKPDSINRKLRVCPIPRNVNPEHNKERRLARARARARRRRRLRSCDAYAAVVVGASTGATKTAASVRTREAHRAEEVSIALAVSDPGCTTVLCDSRTAVKNYAKALVIKWFPAHMGSDVSERGNANHNETANPAARGLTNRAAANTADSECWSWYSAKDKMTSFNEIVKWYKLNRQTMPPPHPGLTRMEAVLYRQLQTGFLLTPVLAKHVCPSMYTSDVCRLCAKERATAVHILWDCSVNPREASEKTTIPPQLEAATRSYDQETQFKAVQVQSAEEVNSTSLRTIVSRRAHERLVSRKVGQDYRAEFSRDESQFRARVTRAPELQGQRNLVPVRLFTPADRLWPHDFGR
ncbi:hypothetical protein HPB47_018797 [Ixodes persulcatus]|uniref:Uncharacterized protein n=1 Tax=Ixodes persulcatus TaxID=34615 RepID=A0AC60QK06_IXOPE|nr:hypothetical protein HPB47_018797 [Ixodes persulcatus]